MVSFIRQLLMFNMHNILNEFGLDITKEHATKVVFSIIDNGMEITPNITEWVNTIFDNILYKYKQKYGNYRYRMVKNFLNDEKYSFWMNIELNRTH